jgi:chaperonin GroES
MRVIPLGEHVVVKRLPSEPLSAGGIILPESAQEPPQQGKVLSVGDGRRMSDGTRAKNQVREGDRILFGAYAGAAVTVNDEELLILSEDEILAIVA